MYSRPLQQSYHCSGDLLLIEIRTRQSNQPLHRVLLPTLLHRHHIRNRGWWCWESWNLRRVMLGSKTDLSPLVKLGYRPLFFNGIGDACLKFKLWKIILCSQCCWLNLLEELRIFFHILCMFKKENIYVIDNLKIEECVVFVFVFYFIFYLKNIHPATAGKIWPLKFECQDRNDN